MRICIPSVLDCHQHTHMTRRHMRKWMKWWCENEGERERELGEVEDGGCQLDENEWSTYVRAPRTKEMRSIKTKITCATVLMWNYYTSTVTRISAIESVCKYGVETERVCAARSRHGMISPASDCVRLLLRFSNFTSHYSSALKTFSSLAKLHENLFRSSSNVLLPIAKFETRRHTKSIQFVCLHSCSGSATTTHAKCMAFVAHSYSTA